MVITIRGRTPYQEACEAGTAQCQQWADSARQGLRAAVCRKCHARMMWATNHKTGKKVPLDRDPDPLGNIVFVGYELVHYLSRGDVVPGGPGTPRFTSHFGTCPYAESFRS